MIDKLCSKHTVTATTDGGTITTEIELQVRHFPPESLSFPDLNLTVGEEFEGQQVVLEPEFEDYGYEELSTYVVFSIQTAWDEEDIHQHPGSNSEGTSLPEGLTFDLETGTLSGTPKYEAIGKMQVTIKAQNSGGMVSSSFTITTAAQKPTSLAFPEDILQFTVNGDSSYTPKLEPDTLVDYQILPLSPGAPEIQELGIFTDPGSGEIAGTGEPFEGVMDKLTHKYTMIAKNSGAALKLKSQ